MTGVRSIRKFQIRDIRHVSNVFDVLCVNHHRHSLILVQLSAGNLFFAIKPAKASLCTSVSFGSVSVCHNLQCDVVSNGARGRCSSLAVLVFYLKLVSAIVTLRTLLCGSGLKIMITLTSHMRY